MQAHEAAAIFSLDGDRDATTWEVSFICSMGVGQFIYMHMEQETIMRLVRPFELILLKPPTPPPDAQQVAAFERDWSSHVTDELTLFTYATARWRGIDTALKHLLQQVSYLTRDEPSARMITMRLELFRLAIRRVMRSLAKRVT